MWTSLEWVRFTKRFTLVSTSQLETNASNQFFKTEVVTDFQNRYKASKNCFTVNKTIGSNNTFSNSYWCCVLVKHLIVMINLVYGSVSMVDRNGDLLTKLGTPTYMDTCTSM